MGTEPTTAEIEAIRKKITDLQARLNLLQQQISRLRNEIANAGASDPAHVSVLQAQLATAETEYNALRDEQQLANVELQRLLQQLPAQPQPQPPARPSKPRRRPQTNK